MVVNSIIRATVRVHPSKVVSTWCRTACYSTASKVYSNGCAEKMVYEWHGIFKIAESVEEDRWLGRPVDSTNLQITEKFVLEDAARYYTKKHEWVAVSGDIGTIGISSYAQDALGEVVFVQLPDVGREVSAGEECGALESVKAASEVFTPVSGTITEKNVTLEATPSIINKSCYEDGWLFRLKLSSTEELKQLMDQAAYDKFLEESH